MRFLSFALSQRRRGYAWARARTGLGKSPQVSHRRPPDLEGYTAKIDQIFDRSSKSPRSGNATSLIGVPDVALAYNCGDRSVRYCIAGILAGVWYLRTRT